jgi:Bacterial type II/III secretion system short domain
LVKAAVALLVVTAATALAADQELRVFQLHFRPARDAAALVEPLLSADGSVLLQPSLNAITVRDSAAVLERVARALASWDVAPAAYKVRIRLLLANTDPQPPGQPAPLIEGIGSELRELFHFTNYQEVATLQVTASDGSVVELAAGDRYHLRFTVRGVPQDPDRVQLAQLQLSRRDRGANDVETLRPLVRATVTLLVKQPSVLGGARSENANQALFLVLWAEREEKP